MTLTLKLMMAPEVIVTSGYDNPRCHYDNFRGKTMARIQCVLCTLGGDVNCYLHREPWWNVISMIRSNYAHAVFPQSLILSVVLPMIYNAGLGWFIKNYFQRQCLSLARLFHLSLYLSMKQSGTVICNLGPDYDAYGELNGGWVCVRHLINKSDKS